MGRKIVLVGDLGTDHDGFPPTPVTTGSPTVTIDGKPVARQGDPLAPHDKPNHGPHPRFIAAGSATILVDGKPVALTDDPVDCGGKLVGTASGESDDIASGTAMFSTGTLSRSSTIRHASYPAMADTPKSDAQSESASAVSEKPPMAMSAEGRQWLKSVEQLRLRPYDDQTGKDIALWVEGATIGYGHLIARTDWRIYQNGITPEQANQLFDDDLSPFEAAVNDIIKVELASHEFDAAVMLAYNIGVAAFSSSSAAKLINDPNASTPYPSLEDAWKAWKKSQGSVNRGLVNRRNAEWQIFSQGIYARW